MSTSLYLKPSMSGPDVDDNVLHGRQKIKNQFFEPRSQQSSPLIKKRGQCYDPKRSPITLTGVKDEPSRDKRKVINNVNNYAQGSYDWSQRAQGINTPGKECKTYNTTDQKDFRPSKRHIRVNSSLTYDDIRKPRGGTADNRRSNSRNPILQDDQSYVPSPPRKTVMTAQQPSPALTRINDRKSNLPSDIGIQRQGDIKRDHLVSHVLTAACHQVQGKINQTRGKGVCYAQPNTSAILSYQDAPKYRPDQVSGKITEAAPREMMYQPNTSQGQNTQQARPGAGRSNLFF